MHTYPSAVPLLEKWEEYVRAHPQGSLDDFAGWLGGREKKARPVSPEATRMTVYLEPEKWAAVPGYNPDHHAGYLIGRLYKFVRFYMKPLLHEAGFHSAEEFGFLASLRELKACNKKELIEANMTELTTGLDIIRRLVKAGLVEEKTHPQDRRAKLLQNTQKGEAALDRLVALFGRLPVVLPEMTGEEKDHLIRTLEHLDRYHTGEVEKYR
jgi:DNA-binding MarR family transcriptional regulator